jgi:alpha-N-arabinofuranosidase
LYLAHEDKFVITPVGHVFELYAAHQGGQALRTIFSSATLHYDRDAKPASFWGLQGAASLRDKEVTITAVNPSLSDSRLAEIALRGVTVKEATVTLLTNSDPHAYNSFEHRDNVIPQAKAVTSSAGNLIVEFPPASVAALKVHLN